MHPVVKRNKTKAVLSMLMWTLQIITSDNARATN